MTKETICLCCKARFAEPDECLQHPCNPLFRVTNGLISIELSKATGLKRTRWGRLLDNLDISWCLAFTGLVVMNCVLVSHINLTFTECLIESLSFGFAIPKLLK